MSRTRFGVGTLDLLYIFFFIAIVPFFSLSFCRPGFGFIRI